MIWLTEFRTFLFQIYHLVRKEFLALLKDPKSRAILIVPVIAQSLLFGYAATYDLTYSPYVLFDASRSIESRELVRRIDATGIFSRAATLSSQNEIAPMIISGKTAVAISIPPDFARRLAGGENAPVQLILDGRNSMTAALSAAYIGSIAARYSAERFGAAQAIQIERRAWYNENLNSRWTILVGLIAALAMIQTLLTSAFSVAREREQGTFDQLLVTPLRPLQILIGKAVAPVVVGLVQSSVIFCVIRFWFGLPLAGSALLIFAVLVVFNLAAVGLGLSISAYALTMQQAMLYAFLAIVPMMLLSGLFSPVSNMAEVLQWVTYANPMRFGMDAVRRIYLEGAGLEQIWFDFVPLAVMAGVMMPLAAWLFRNRMS
jgi:ABC-2 type transport system permease protein